MCICRLLVHVEANMQPLYNYLYLHLFKVYLYCHISRRVILFNSYISIYLAFFLRLITRSLSKSHYYYLPI